MSFSLEYAARARKDLTRLDATVVEREIRALEQFAANQQGDVLKLTGVHPPEYRLRVGDWRVLFELDHAASTVRVLPRGEAYR